MHRLLQFALLGGGIFALAPSSKTSGTIELGRAHLAALTEAEARKPGRRTPDPQQIEERAIEDEILVREARRLGLDDNDAVVRQRLIQKMLYVAEELEGAADPPTPKELRGFFDSTREEWRRPERVQLRQIFARDPEALRSDPPRPEASPIPGELSETPSGLRAALGNEFALGVAELLPGQRGLVRSAFGWHLVDVVSRSPEGPASFEDVESALRSVYLVRRRERAIARYLDQAFTRYRVTIEGRPVPSIHPGGRLAVRSESSAED
jgi:hypothetical protein